jgi:PAS domain S-box-containing protein
MFLKDTPIRRKLVIVILLTSGTVLLLTSAAFITYEVITLRKGMVRGLTTRAEIIAANSTAALAFGDAADATDVLSALRRDPRMMAGCIYNQQGLVFATYPEGTPIESLPLTIGKGHRFQENFLELFVPIAQGDRILGTVYLRSDLTALTERYRAYALLSFGVLLGSFIVAYVMSKMLQKQISQPILSLAETSRAIAERRDYSVRAAKLSEDELGLLTDAFNQMLTRIQTQNQTLKESEERVRAVLNSAISAVVVIDSHSKIVDWNSRAESMFGWLKEEAFGKDVAEIIIPPRYREAHVQGMKRFLSTGEGPVLNRLVELTALRRNGTEFPVELSISPMHSRDGIAFCGFITDISERKRAEQQVQLQATALETAGNGIMITDNKGSILWVNPAFSALTGYPMEDVIGQTPRILKSGRHGEKFYKDLWDTIQAGDTWRGQFANLRKDGSLYHDEHTITPVRSKNGEITHFIAIMQDITERKQSEGQIRKLNATLEQRVNERTALLEAANKELEAFSYSVSHDLRAPLRHINGFADMLKQEASSLNSTGQRYIGIISDAAKRMGTLIDDLLVFSRMGRAEMRRGEVNMNELVAESLQEMASDVGGRNIQWDIGKLPTVNGDRAMLKQVWVNLLSNAVKYTRHRERAEIRVFSKPTPTDGCEFVVKDNGAGFDMQYADKLFGVFQRLHHAEEFEGTGVGLANVRRIVMRHGGQTWAEGEVDVGATFHFTLPANS